MFEIWKAINGRKSYLVKNAEADAYDFIKGVMKYFKVAYEKIHFQKAWIYNDELYLEDPHKSKTKTVLVAYLKRKGE